MTCSDNDQQPSTTATPGSVVVGVDGSLSSDRAVDWAMRQATLQHRRLTLVHAAHLGPAGDPLWVGEPSTETGRFPDHVAAAGRELLTTTADRVRRSAPGVEVETVQTRQDPRELLLDCTDSAAVTVVGSRGRGAIASLLLGSVGLTVATHAAGPVVVVRGSSTDVAGSGVVVDVDGTADSVPAIELAYDIASFRGLPLTALHVFFDVHDLGVAGREVLGEDPGVDDRRALLAEAVTGMQEKYPDVQDRLLLRRGFRDLELIEAGKTAALLVVGTRHHGHLHDLLHRSVAATVVEHAVCDVAVVPVGVT